MAGCMYIDLDGTLAHYEGWDGIENIGAPIPEMVALVKRLLNNGWNVKIFTARAHEEMAIKYVREWVKKHIGQYLEVTNVKGFDGTFFVDDRAIMIPRNTGKPCCAKGESTLEEFKRLIF